jgi:hypothetical protein
MWHTARADSFNLGNITEFCTLSEVALMSPLVLVLQFGVIG